MAFFVFVCLFFLYFFPLLLFFNIVFLKIQSLLQIFNLCFLVFVVNFVHVKTQSSVPNFTWERDYWLDHSPLLWTLLFLHQVSSVSSLPLLFSTQPCESLCVPDGGEHSGNWLLAGSLSLPFISLFYLPGHLCLLPPSPLPCITPWTSMRSRLWSPIRKWLLASLLSPLLIPPHLIPVTFNYPSLFSSPCNSVNLSGCPSMWRNFSSLT